MKATFYTGKSKDRCFLFHRWEIIHDNGFTVYDKCKRCGERRVRQPKNGSYQPIDWDWLTFKSDEINNKE